MAHPGLFMGSLLRSLLFFALTFFSIHLSRADIVNRTSDDSLGDSATHVPVTYLPTTNGVWQDEKCTTCSITPDISQMFSGTYTAATHMPGQPPISITVDFTGIALWVFFTLANNVSGAVTQTSVNFTLDGGSPKFYNHDPDLTTTDFQYKALVFQNDSLANTHHTLVISTSQSFPDPVYVNFDYAIYTHEDIVATPSGNATVTSSASPTISPSATTSPTASPTASATAAGGANSTQHLIIGGVLAGVAATMVLLFALYCCTRYRKRMARQRNTDDANKLGVPTPYVDTPPPANYSAIPAIPDHQRHRDTSLALSLPLSKRALEGRELANPLLQRDRGPIPISTPSATEYESLPSREVSSARAAADSCTANTDHGDPRRERQSHIAQHLRDLHQEFVDLAAQLGTHDTASHLNLTSRGDGVHEHDEHEAINTLEMREQLLMIQAQIEDIEAQQSFILAEPGRQPSSLIRPPEYSS